MEKFWYYAASALLVICLNGYILLLFSGKLENVILRIGAFVEKAMRKIKRSQYYISVLGYFFSLKIEMTPVIKLSR